MTRRYDEPMIQDVRADMEGNHADNPIIEPQVSPRRWMIAALVALIAVALGWGIGSFLTAPADPAPGFAASGPMFDSIDELAAASDLIVVGAVEGVQVGEELPNEGEATPTRRLNAVLDVQTVLKGSVPREGLTVATLELAYAAPQAGSGSDWRQPGTRVVAFLVASSEGATGNAGEPLFFPTSYPQSFYVVEGESLRAAYQESDEALLSERIERMNVSELLAALPPAP